MSSIWDGTGEPTRDDEIAATVRDAIVEADARNARITRFHDTVRDGVPGQLGELLRQIATAHADHVEAERWGGTTSGEETRLNRILDEAMSTLDWLREGVASDG